MSDDEITVSLPPRGDPSVPDAIGPYRVLEQLGEGGMGVVYLAEQSEPIRRRVAIKVIRLGLATRELVARFDSERRALALMSHSGIARIIDAGSTPDSRPYFVMEYVAGVPITDYCDQRRLPIEERLSLFHDVCLALQHAHQKGIIHRDLKPSNILVAIENDRPVPKVIDFGIAKLTTDSLRDGTHTQIGTIIGTPQYASPEQLGTTPYDVDTRADVYSLGVILYELLTGSLPLDFPDGFTSFSQLQRTIDESEPLAPSRKVESFGAAAEELGLRRALSTPALVRRLRGDLDWISMRALERERARRYGSAAELAHEIERHLANKPVRAGPPGGLYRLGKFVRRNAVLVASVSAIIATLAVSGTLFTVRLADERDAARQAARRSDAMASFLFSLFDSADPYAEDFGEVEVDAARKLVRRGINRAAIDLADDPDTRADMLGKLGEVQLNIRDTEEAEKTIRAAIAQQTALYGASDPAVLHLSMLLGRTLWEQSRNDEAETQLETVLAAMRATPGVKRDDIAEAARMLGRLKRAKGDMVAAERLYREAIEIRREVLGERHIDYASTLSDLSGLYRQIGREKEAEALQRDALRVMEAAVGPRHPEVAVMKNNLATILPRERAEEAVALLRSAIEIQTAVFGSDARELVGPNANLASRLAELGRFDEARPLADRAVEQARKTYGPNHERVGRYLSIAGNICLQQGDLAAAERYLREAISILARVHGDGNVRVATPRSRLGEMLTRAGRFAEAERELLASESIYAKSSYTKDHVEIRENHERLARLYTASGRAAEAAKWGAAPSAP